MKNLPDEDEPLTSLLRAQMPPLADEDFSRQVIAQLPAPTRRYRGLAWIAAGAGAGVAFALSKGASWSDVEGVAPALKATFSASWASFADPWLFIALATTTASLLVSYLIRRMYAG